MGRGQRIHLDSLGLFYSVSVPLIFLGWIFVYLGILEINPVENKRKIYKILGVWFLASFFAHLFQFFTENSYNNLIPRFSVSLTLIPINILILISLIRWFKKDLDKGFLTSVGIATMILAMAISVFRYLLVLRMLVNYQPSLWFLSLISNDAISLLRSVVVIVLTVGAVLVHRYSLISLRK